ncbi:MAG: GNAT family N-acetyltransferase [Dehalococcoidales bacterium]|jgi:ribosomal protein S18 acetylase RimI-like enzyme
MKTVEKNAVKIHRMVDSDITPALGIWWADIPEKEMVASQLRGPLNLSFIAEYDGVLAGFLLAALAYSGMPMTGTGVVFLIAVNPEYQKHGIGMMLVNAFEEYCRSKGIKTVRAIIPRSDTRIIKYFSKAGFSQSNLVNYDKSCAK